MLLAAQKPFLRVEGIELSEALCREASANAERATLRAPVIVRHADATAYDLPPEPLILYLFNPFGAPVLARRSRQCRDARCATRHATPMRSM